MLLVAATATAEVQQRTRSGGWPALLVMLGLCSSLGCASKQSSPGTDATTETTPPDAGTDTGVAADDAAASPTTRICDGGNAVRLAVQLGGGGPSEVGVAMLSEIGYQFLFVDGTCHAWVQLSPYDSMRELTLTAEREQALINALRIGSWKDISMPTEDGCADGSSIDYRFEKQHLFGPTCGVFLGTAWSNLITSFQEQMVALAAMGVPAMGSVRYLLVPKPAKASNDSRTPVAWPLANVDPAAVALSEQNSFQYKPGDSQRATGSDATALRAIRSNTSAASTDPVNAFTPIRASGGALYFLYIRDALPFESDNGLLPTDLFQDAR